MAGDRPVTVRVPDTLLDQLNGLSIVDGCSLAEVLRTGLAHYVRERQSADSFQDEVAQAQQRQFDQLAALARA